MSDWPWPAPEDDGGVDHLVAGMRMPDLDLPSTDGGSINLRRYAGGTYVLFVYPWTGGPGLANPPNWDFIPGAHGSTPQAQAFANAEAKFRAAGFALAGLSGQTSDHQRELVARLRLPYPILSDAAANARTHLRLPTFETGGYSYLKRLSLVVADGRIARTFYPVHPPDRHPADVLACLIGTPVRRGP